MGMNTSPIGPFFGIDNRRPPNALRVGGRYKDPGNHLHDAVNVEVDAGGGLVRRRGEEKILALPGAHSLHLYDDAHGVVAAESVLYHVDVSLGTLTMLHALTTDAPVSYAQAGDAVYYSNGTDSGRLVGTSRFPLGLPTPAAPAVTAISGGLPPGRYLVWLAYLDGTTGEEGGLSHPSVIGGASGGVRVTLPSSSPPGATHAAVYLSGPDGAVPRLAATVPLGAASASLTSPAAGREGVERHEAPLPPGALFLANGRLCSYAGGLITVGEPYRYGYYRPSSGYLSFFGEIALVMPVQGGVYVVADQTYFLPGDLGSLDRPLVTVLPYGGVPGTGFALPDRPLVGWFGQEGLVIADATGQVEAVMAEHVDVGELPARGVSAVLTRRGHDRIVSCDWCVALASKAVTRYEGWGLTSVSREWATKDDGLYRLDVRSEDEIPWRVDFGEVDFSTEARKRLTCVYLGIEGGDGARVRVESPGQGVYTYAPRRCDDSLQIQRADVGKGLIANWYRLGLFGETDFRLASVSFGVAATRRRI